MNRRTVAIYIFDGVEPLDAVGPFEVFLCGLDESGAELFDVGMVAETDDDVTAVGGLVMRPRWTFATLPETDILLVPGGQGTRRLVDRPDITRWIRDRSSRTGLMLSVCTGAHLLAAAGLLAGLAATTHWNTWESLKRIEPTVDIRQGVRWTDNGHIVCSSGVSAGIDMSLHIIERLHGSATAARAARSMEYEYWQQGT